MTFMVTKTRTILMCLVVLICLAWTFTIVTDPAEYDPSTGQIMMIKEGQ